MTNGTTGTKPLRRVSKPRSVPPSERWEGSSRVAPEAKAALWVDGTRRLSKYV